MTDRKKDREMGRRTKRKEYRQIDKQTDGQTEIKTDRKTELKMITMATVLCSVEFLTFRTMALSFQRSFCSLTSQQDAWKDKW